MLIWNFWYPVIAFVSSGYWINGIREVVLLFVCFMSEMIILAKGVVQSFDQGLLP